MSTQTCPHCSTVMSSTATVCRGCGAEKKVEYDNSTFGLIKGYFASVVAALFFGFLIGAMFNVVAGVLVGIVLGAVCAYLVNQFGVKVETWVR
jgi:uncharacterized membrane protein